jgi:hypothetical protein
MPAQDFHHRSQEGVGRIEKRTGNCNHELPDSRDDRDVAAHALKYKKDSIPLERNGISGMEKPRLNRDKDGTRTYTNKGSFSYF